MTQLVLNKFSRSQGTQLKQRVLSSSELSSGSEDKSVLFLKLQQPCLLGILGKMILDLAFAEKHMAIYLYGERTFLSCMLV